MRLISDEAVELVIHLKMNTTLSETKIAKAAKISRGSVKRIIDGELFHKPKALKQQIPNYKKGKKVRCSACGAMVIYPCLACRPSMLKSRLNDDNDEQLQLELEGEQYNRYHDITPKDSVMSIRPVKEKSCAAVRCYERVDVKGGSTWESCISPE